MKLINFIPRVIVASLALILFCAEVTAQTEDKTPDKAVAGIELGNRERSKEFLGGYGPTIGEDGRPNYYFYNKYATQVLRAVAQSFDDPFYVTEIEVYSVGKSYRRKHFQLKNMGFFKSDHGIFIGYKESAASILSGFAIGVNNPGGKNRIGPKSLQGRNGEPDEVITEKDSEIFKYKIDEIELADGARADFRASYTLRKSKLSRFSVSIDFNRDFGRDPEPDTVVNENKP